MKYNRSLIFKRAWELKRSGMDFSKALKLAWYEAKLVPVKKEEPKEDQYFIVDDAEYIEELERRKFNESVKEKNKIAEHIINGGYRDFGYSSYREMLEDIEEGLDGDFLKSII